MDLLRSIWENFRPGVPLVVTLALVALVFALMRLFFERRQGPRSGQPVGQQVLVMVVWFVGIIAVVLAAPLSDAQKGQLLSLIGILLSAAIALSSTTFVGNAMAGVLLRVVRSFRTGDFIRVGDCFGRVSDRGLFHTEIQTEDRDLMTLPNLYLATNPVRVIRSSGTMLATELSLGYDVHWTEVEAALLKAARNTELVDPFVHVMHLGDFSVTYRVSGLLEDVKSLLSARSRLREEVLDAVHGAGIEIVSPTFMNQRVQPEGKVYMAAPRVASAPEPDEARAEDQIFDKAEQAESREAMHEAHVELTARIVELEKMQKAAEDEELKSRLEKRLEGARGRLERLTRALESEPPKD